MNGEQHPSVDAVRTIFLGSGKFALPILEALVQAPEIHLVGIVSAPDRPGGRGGELTSVPIARRAVELSLPLLQLARLRAPDAIAKIAALKPDLGVLADYGQIVPPSVLTIPTHGILNVHPSDLPRHRGAAPIAAMIVDGDSIAAVTLILMDQGLDTGPIVAKQTWSLTGEETAETLEADAAQRGGALLLRSIGPWLAGALSAVPQVEAAATRTRPLRRDDGRLDPRMTAEQLERRVRAHGPWPGSFMDTGIGRLIVHQASASSGAPDDVPGTLVADGDGLALATATGRLRVIRAQLAGRRVTDAPALLRGAPGLVGQTVELG